MVVTGELVALLTNLRERIAALENHIATALAAHIDAAVFTGLPHAGTVRAATLPPARPPLSVDNVGPPTVDGGRPYGARRWVGQQVWPSLMQRTARFISSSGIRLIALAWSVFGACCWSGKESTANARPSGRA